MLIISVGEKNPEKNDAKKHFKELQYEDDMESALLCLALSLGPMISYAQAEEAPLTRATMAQWLVDTFSLSYDADMAQSFSDVPDMSPYYEAICVCVAGGIIRLTGNTGSYDPNGLVSREQAAVMLWQSGLPEGIPEALPAGCCSGKMEL